MHAHTHTHTDSVISANRPRCCCVHHSCSLSSSKGPSSVMKCVERRIRNSDETAGRLVIEKMLMRVGCITSNKATQANGWSDEMKTIRTKKGYLVIWVEFPIFPFKWCAQSFSKDEGKKWYRQLENIIVKIEGLHSIQGGDLPVHQSLSVLKIE